MKILNINSYYYSSSVHRQIQIALLDIDINSLTYVPLAKGYVPREECKYERKEYIDSTECYSVKDRYIFHIKHQKILNDISKRYDFDQFDWLHAHSLFSNGYIALQIKKKFGVPYIVAVRDTDINTFFKYMIHLRKIGIQILKGAEKVIFLSEPYRNQLIDRYVPAKLKEEIFAKTAIIPNGIDDFWLQNKGYPKMFSKQETLRFLYVGGVNKRKNLMTTIKAIKILQKKGYKVKFTIVGRVEDKSIYQQIKDLLYVQYISPKSKEELLSIYRANDMFVMPSITETFGLVYAEAMSQGIPVIYTKEQGFDGQFNEGEVGYHVDPLNPEDIVDRILDIIHNYERLSQNCIEFCDRFNWTSIVKEYDFIYNSCVISNAERLIKI